MKIQNFVTRQSMNSENFEIYHYRQPYFKTLDFHEHDFYEVYVFIDGDVTYYIDENMYKLLPGDVLLIPPGKSHRPIISNEAAVYERIVLWMRPEFLEKLEIKFPGLSKPIKENKHLFFNFGSEDFEEARNVLYKFIQANETEGFGDVYLTEAYLVIFMVMLNKAIGQEDQNKAQKNDSVIAEIIDYINANFKEDLKVENIAKKFFMSKYHLIREFKKDTNLTIYDYIISKRITYAQKLILKGEKLTNAAFLAGFSDYSNFYKLFIKKVGITPKMFKEANNITQL